MTPESRHQSQPAGRSRVDATADDANDEQRTAYQEQEEPASTRADELKTEIERTRAEMGETAAALAAKLDVTGRVRQSAAETGSRMAESAAEAAGRTAATVGTVPQRVAADPKRYALIGAALAAAAAAIVLIRRSR